MLNLNYSHNSNDKQNNHYYHNETRGGKRQPKPLGETTPMELKPLTTARVNESIAPSNPPVPQPQALKPTIAQIDKESKDISWAFQFYNKFKSNTPHKYLTKKRIQNLFGARVGFVPFLKQKCLLVPMYAYGDKFTVVGYQFIGEKNFELKRKNDFLEIEDKVTNKLTIAGNGYGFYYFGDLSAKRVGLTEGVATGASAWQSGKFACVIVCFSASQLNRACEAFSDKEIIILADNDLKEAKEDLTAIVNTGVQKALDCLHNYKNVINVIYPEFDNSKFSDFNDLHVEVGMERLCEAIEGGLKYNELTRIISRFGARVALEYVDSRYLNGLPDCRYLFGQSGLGTGKTTQLESIVALANSAMYISHRELLSDSVAQKLGLSSYKNKGADSNKISLCLPSLTNEQLLAANEFTGFDYDVVILDECSQILQLFASKLAFNKNAALTMLKLILSQARRVIFFDANITFETINTYMAMLPVDAKATFLVNSAKQYQGRSMAIYTSNSNQERQAIIFEQVKADLLTGERVIVSCDSADQAANLGDFLAITGKKIKVLTAKIRDDNFVRNINELITEYDCLIYSPTIGSGVSIDTPHFTKCYGLFNDHMSPSELWQGTARYRPWQHFMVAMPDKVFRGIDMQSLAQIKKGFIDLEIMDMQSHAATKGLEIDEAANRADIQKRCSDYLNLYAAQEFKNKLERQHFLENFVALGHAYGCEMTITPMGKEARIEARIEAIMADKIELAVMADKLVMEVESVTRANIEEVVREQFKEANQAFREARTETREAQVETIMADSVKVSHLADKLGVDAGDMTHEIVESEIRKNLSSRLKRLSLYFKTNREVAAMHEMETDKAITDKKFNFVRRDLVRMALKEIGIDNGFELNFEGTWLPSDINEKNIAKFIKKHQNELFALGLVSHKTVNNVTRFIHKILRWSGIEIEAKSKRNEAKEVVRVYSIKNKDFLAKWQEKLLGGSEK